MEVFCKDLRPAIFPNDLELFLKCITAIMLKIQALRDLQIFYFPHDQRIIFFKFMIVFYQFKALLRLLLKKIQNLDEILEQNIYAAMDNPNHLIFNHQSF